MFQHTPDTHKQSLNSHTGKAPYPRDTARGYLVLTVAEISTSLSIIKGALIIFMYAGKLTVFKLNLKININE